MRTAREDVITVLTGPVADQAHLAGIIDRVHELGLELIFLRLDETPARSADAGW
ncbi:MAG TPA: hypothetical protein VGN28_11305 [Blastococcus sp.]|jgi:hypothetical protein|nr:hypothetical protein [Blastococcus sp.]